MLLRAGLLVELEGDWQIHTSRHVRGKRDVFRIGAHLYDRQFKAVSPGAPDVLEACDIDSGWKDHRRGRNALLVRWDRQQEEGRAKAEHEKLLASAEGWKHDRPLKAFPKLGFLKVVCINPRCGRLRFDQIGHVCSEGRMGSYTVAEVQRAFFCVGCRDEVRIEYEG